FGDGLGRDRGVLELDVHGAQRHSVQADEHACPPVASAVLLPSGNADLGTGELELEKPDRLEPSRGKSSTGARGPVGWLRAPAIPGPGPFHGPLRRDARSPGTDWERAGSARAKRSRKISLRILIPSRTAFKLL